MKKSTVFLLIALGGLVLLTRTASATTIRPRPNPPIVTNPMPQPIVSAD